MICYRVPRALLCSSTRRTSALIRDIQSAAAAIGRPVDIVPASTNREIDAAFASCAQQHIDGIVIANGALLLDRRVQILTLATYHHLPAIHPYREAAEIG